MKLVSQIVLLTGIAGLGLLAGLALRDRVHARVPAVGPAVSAAAMGAQAHANFNKPLEDTIPLSLAARLERDLSMSAGVTRWLYWLEALEKATPQDFPGLVSLVGGNPTAMRLVAARWLDASPRHLFDTIIAACKEGRGSSVDELAYMLFREWPKRDPEAAIAALNETSSFGRVQSLRHTVAAALFDDDVERGLRLMAEWNIGDFGPRMAGVEKWAAANPRHAAEFTLAHPTGYASRLTMETIGIEWAKTDPAAALEFASGKPGQLGSILGKAALEHWAGQNLKVAADWLAAAEDPVRNQFSPGFLEVWAKQDPTGALAWCDAHLTGSNVAPAVAGLMTGATSKDLPAAAALVTQMNPSHVRAEAAVAVAQKWFPSLASAKPVAPETITWLRGLDSESSRRVLDAVTWEWATSDPKSMAEFLITSGGAQVPENIYANLAREMARRNPADALAWASRLPQAEGLRAGGEAFAEWRLWQPEAAIQWFNDLPTTDARRPPYLESAVRALAYDPQTADQLASLNAADRAAARTVIESLTLPADRRSRLLQLLKN